jgi:predicted hydrocarbon binding protein
MLFEAESFKQNHRGSDVIPRNFLKTDDRHIIVDAPSPGYNCKIIEGVFLGILKMVGEENGKVIQTKCIQRGDSTCIYDITW